MDLIQIMLIIIHIASTLSRRRHSISASDESIENLLYYKDCQVKTTSSSTEKPVSAMRLRETPPNKPAYDCPYPKMCCSLSCNNDCGGTNSMNNILRDGSPMMGGMNGMYGMGGMGDMGDMGMPNMGMNAAPPFTPPEPKRKKKVKPITDPLPPVGARREFGFTKDKIKGLISKDADIRKILKDLVRVTMKKVDLVEMINTKKAIQASINARRTRSEGSQSSGDDLE